MHNLLFYNNGREPTSSVILPYSITKSFCGLAVVHISQFKLIDGRIPAVVWFKLFKQLQGV